MIRHPNLVPECNVDTAFVEMLGYPDPNHAPDIYQVCIILDKTNATIPSIGFIDSDKKKPKYLSDFKLVEKGTYISILKHTDKIQFLVVASPAMDRVIYDLCQDLEIDLPRYGFPKEFKAFLGCTKKEGIKRDAKFKNLLNAIKQKKHRDIEIVKSLVSQYFD